MHPVGRLLSSSKWLPPGWWVVFLLPAATGGALWLGRLASLDGTSTLLWFLALLVLPVVLVAIVRERDGTHSLNETGARLSLILAVSSSAWCLVAGLWMWITFECNCPAEVFTPGRGWHYNDGCFCGFQFAAIALLFIGAAVALFAINLICWLLSMVRALY